jgi:hypothetical protein
MKNAVQSNENDDDDYQNSNNVFVKRSKRLFDKLQDYGFKVFNHPSKEEFKEEIIRKKPFTNL